MREYLIRLTPGRGRDDTKVVRADGYERRGAWFEFYAVSSAGRRDDSAPWVMRSSKVST